MTVHLIISLAVALTLIVFRSRVTAWKSVLISTSADMAEEAMNQGKGARDARRREAFLQVRKDPEKVSNALRACSLACIVLAGPLAIVPLHHLLAAAFFGVGISAGNGDAAAAELTPGKGALVLSLAFLSVLFVAQALELFCRSVSSSGDPGRTALKIAPAALRITALVHPCLKGVAGLVSLVLKPFGIRVRLRPPSPSLEELERLLAQAANANASGISRQTPKLIHNIFEMNDHIARDIMVPRTQVVAIALDTPPEQIVSILSETGHSRMPVYDGEIDNIVGILHSRDLVPMLQCPELIVLQDVIRPAFFVPWSKPLGDLLRVMQKKRIHMAAVVDEYGGFLGAVTLEDLLETIVGEIKNEYGAEEPAGVERMSDGTYVISGSASVAETEEKLGIRLSNDKNCETMSGLMSCLSGCIPEEGEKIFINGCMMTVEARTDRKVSRIRCQRVSMVPEEARKV